jgi:hypothetical protein
MPELRSCRPVDETLSRFAIAPTTPIAAFVKRLRCGRCGSQSVLATRRERPKVHFVLGADLVTIALGWLIAWGCIALGRWVHRGFAAQ